MANRMMRAVEIEKFGDADSLSVKENIPVPQVGKYEVLIQMKAVGINELELRVRSNGWRTFKPPFILGFDGAGIIDSVGEGVTTLKPGDRVYVFQPITGTYAEYCLAAQDRVYKLPNNLSFEEGAVLPNPYFCSIRCFTRAGFKKGETVLVNGASGGFGLGAIQLARGLGASKVVGTAGTMRGRELVKQMGADEVIDYKSPDFKRNLRDIFGPEGVDIIIETNVDVNFEMDMELVARMGRIVVIGKRGKTVCTPQNLVFKETTVLGCALFFCDSGERKIMSEIIDHGANEGWLKPYVGTTFKLSEVAASHKFIENRRGASGKLILLIDSSAEV
ncbi:quinone oxidoreductase-like [Lytechinus pictus]|uniref:quinone oxidoreductase-like n=1 Tax=Lytechinus pictus TaxID=7653 RepID=UPI0030B9FAD9